MIHKPKIIATIVIAAAAITLIGVFFHKLSNKQESTPDVKYGQLRFTSGSLVHVATELGHFKEQGLSLQEINFSAGPDVLTGLRAVNDPIIAGTVAITPIANSIAAGGNPVIIASIFHSDRQAQLITFSSSGISENPSTLRGKRIGLTRNTIADIYLDRLLRKGGLRRQDVVVVAGRPPEIKGLLLRGEIDAQITWDPFLVQTEREYREGVAADKLKNRGEIRRLVDPLLYNSTIVIVTSPERLRDSRPQLLAMLRALRKTNDLFVADRTRAQQIVEQWLGVLPNDLNDVFKDSIFRLELRPQELQHDLEAELEWLRENQPDMTVPRDVSRYIDPSLLNEVDPKLLIHVP